MTGQARFDRGYLRALVLQVRGADPVIPVGDDQRTVLVLDQQDRRKRLGLADLRELGGDALVAGRQRLELGGTEDVLRFPGPGVLGVP